MTGDSDQEIQAPSDQEIRTLLEQYKDLRSEIRSYLSQDTNRHLAFWITTAMLAFAVAIQQREKAPELPMFCLYSLVAIMIIVLWLADIFRLLDVFRISGFIRTFIEPKISGLFWERRTAEHPISKRTWKSVFLKGDYIFLFILHSAFASKNAHDWAMSCSAPFPLIYGPLYR